MGLKAQAREGVASKGGRGKQRARVGRRDSPSAASPSAASPAAASPAAASPVAASPDKDSPAAASPAAASPAAASPFMPRLRPHVARVLQE